MQHYRLKFWWTLAVFFGAFFFYALTACTVLYPGASTQFLAELFFVDYLPASMTHLPDRIVFASILQVSDLAQTTVVCAMVSAFIGALTITFLFRAAVAGVRLMCVDHATLPDDARETAQKDDNATVLVVGLGTAMMGLVALPMWASATRPLPTSCTTLLAIATLTLALGVRWRCALGYFFENPLGWKCRVLIANVFAAATFLLFLDPTLLPVSIFAICLAGWILVQQELDGRVTYIYTALGGAAVGAILSMGVVALWKCIFLPESTMPALLLWATHVQTTFAALIPFFMNFDGACQLALCVAAFALYKGCFPYAYLDLGRPLIGQLSLMALLVLSFAQWPVDFWQTHAEPTALITCGMLFLILANGTLFGSWVRNWFDPHAHWTTRRSMAVACTILFAPILVVVIASLWCHSKSAAGGRSQAELEAYWTQMDAALPQSTTLWWKPDPQLHGVLINRTISGSPIQPAAAFTGDLSALTLGGKNFEQLSAEDPVIAVLRPHGSAALSAYLLARFTDEMTVGPLPVESLEQMEAARESLEKSSFAETPVGHELLIALRAQIARAYVIAAYGKETTAAAADLRRAYALDPENISAIVSLDAMSDEEYLPISEEERLAAADLIEHDVYLRAPSHNSARLLAFKYGPVRSEKFRAALRLHRLLNVDLKSMLARLHATYLENPKALSERERVLAVLTLPEADVGQRLLQGEPLASEVMVYLCAYPKGQLADALWEKYHATLLEDDKGLRFLRQTMADGTRRQVFNRAHTFFQDTKDFGYALFYVQELLIDGHIEEAQDFVSGFKVQEYLGATPCLAEILRALVAQALIARDAEKARTILQVWLNANPNQILLWDLHLTNSALTEHPTLRQTEVLRCLQVFPFHRIASQWLADQLRTTAGEEAALRYLEAVNTARENALNDEGSYAHR